ncbi:odorant receptor 13a-like [Aphidius gifuensis]|uniref:Odorant receptor n=1 Tax=Aphidius gifuensis TaxID=684658 RepID=A0A3Q9ELG4_APHGI|nr:odorant receptor 13a-like [Aphidius gifuensis]AZQ24946.1 odorant receptor [Aphidius gifuensis]
MKKTSEVNFFDNPNWYMLKVLLSAFGGWPYQKASTSRTIKRAVLFVFLLSTLLPLIFKVYKEWKDLHVVLVCGSQILMHAGTLTNAIYCFLNLDKTRKLLSEIREIWNLNLSKNEFKYFNYFANNTRKITETYIIGLYIMTFFCLTYITVPTILNILLPLNVSRTTIYPYEHEYLFIDNIKYENYILINGWISTFIQITVIVAFDCCYSQLIYFNCSWFYVVGIRMKNLTTIGDLKFENKTILFINCIREHIKALEFADSLQTIYATPLFLLLIYNTVIISMTGCNIIYHIDDNEEVIRFICFVVSQFFHLFFLSWHGEKLIEYSGFIFDFIYEMKWYDVPKNASKFIILILIRSSKPSTLKAHILVVSLETFAMISKTALSYFTALSSFK